MVDKNSPLVYKYIPYPEFFNPSITYATQPRIDRNKKPQKLLDQLRDAIRARHYSIRTEKCYADWVRQFILFHNKRHPREMSAPEVEAFLTHLKVTVEFTCRLRWRASTPIGILWGSNFRGQYT